MGFDIDDLVQQLTHALENAAKHLSAVDVSNAEANLASVRYRPLTEQVITAAGAGRQYLAEQASSRPAHFGVVHPLQPVRGTDGD